MPHHKAKEASSCNGNSSTEDMATQLVPSVGAILLTVTSQSWQNALQKTDLLTLGSRDTMYIDHVL